VKGELERREANETIKKREPRGPAAAVGKKEKKPRGREE
jgi:hypothetical protein